MAEDYSGEYSDRGREVTQHVALWIANEGAYDNGERIAFRARDFAREGDLAGLAGYVSNIIKSHPEGRMVRAELAANDYERINWNDVAAELTVE